MTTPEAVQDSDAASHRLRIDDQRTFYRYVRLRWRLMFALIDCFGWLLFWPTHVFRRIFNREPPEPRFVRSVLVIQLDHFGDGVLSLGLLHWLKKRFPAASLEVLCADWNVELFEKLSHADRVHVLKQTRFARAGSWRWVRALLFKAWQLRRRKYDLAIDVRGEFPHALAMRVAGARHRIGWASGGGGFLLTRNVSFVPARHEVSSRAAIATQILGKAVREEDVAPQITSHANQYSQLWRNLETLVPSGAIALHIGAGTTAKMWPADSWIELVGDLLREHERTILLLGGSGEQALAKRITEAHVPTEDLFDLTGKVAITDLPGVFARCGVLVGADSGPAHLAASCGLPVIALFSGTNHPEQWKPWGDHVRVLKQNVACSPCHREVCPLAEHPCLTGITVSQVLAAVDSTLSEPAELRRHQGLDARRTSNRQTTS